MARPADCSDAEWQARQELAACYRIFHLWGWTEQIYNHISLRVPGPERHFLINRFGLHYSEICASNLLKVDLSGRVLGEGGGQVNAAGFHPHATLHGNIDHCHCVMHTHTTAGMAVASSATGLLITNFYAAQLGGRVAYHDFEGITVHADEAPRLLASMGNKPLLILRNHGLLSHAATLPLAFVQLWTLQRACEIQLAQAALGPCIPVPEAVAHKTTVDSLQFDVSFGAGQDVFDALVRQVDRLDDSYKK